MNNARLFTVVVGAALVSACGGGGNNATTTPVTPPTGGTTPVTPVTPPTTDFNAYVVSLVKQQDAASQRASAYILTDDLNFVFSDDGSVYSQVLPTN